MTSDVEMAEPMPDITFTPAPVDPDAQATVTDFVDYTELFPSDLIRSLTLIGKLDRTYKDAAAKVHDLTAQYGSLPNLRHDSRPEPQALRTQISQALDQALASREAAYAEAARLSLVAKRHFARLTTITKKLKAMPQPPSRDPTPAATSPQATRSRRNEPHPPPRITLHVDGELERATSVSLKTQKQKNVLVPGDVLPPGAEAVYSAAESDDEHSASEAASEDELGLDAPDQAVRGGKAGRVKVPKPPKQRPKTPKPPRIRPPGVMGTNVHSTVAGISTSNALAMLTPPPPDAKPGSKYRPWLKLTEYEMAKLRKSMKKNAIWKPSDTMVRRELEKDGRGFENYNKAKAESEAKGETLLDEDKPDSVNPAAVLAEVPQETPGKKESEQAVNRGMRLNEAKKQKRGRKEKELQELEEASRKIAAAGDAFKNLFSTPPMQHTPKPSKKRKRDSEKTTPAVDATALPPAAVEAAARQPSPKKLRLTPAGNVPIAPKPVERRLAPKAASPPRTTTVTTTIQVPLAPAGPSSSPTKSTASRRQPTPAPPATSPTETKKAPPVSQPIVVPTAAQSRSRRTSSGSKPIAPIEPPAPVVPAPPPPPPPPPSHEKETKELRPRSRGSLARSVKAASADPPTKPQESREVRELRRASVVDTHHPASEP
jgi:hypothetical protein